MEYRYLGNRSIKVSILGLGTVQLGRDKGTAYKKSYALPSHQEAKALIDQAEKLGINLIDTAPSYGVSESLIGTLIQNNRDRWVVCSKVGEEFDGKKSTFDFTGDSIRKSIERSVTRLRSDYLDIALIHSDGNDLDILDTWRALETLQELQLRGLIKAVGISHKTIDGAKRAISLGADVIMTTLNHNAQKEGKIIELASQRGCGVLIKKPLARGYRGPADLSWIAKNPGVSSAIVGTINPEHLVENARWICS